MAKIKNSLSTFLEQAIIVNNNSLEALNKMTDAMTSTEDSVKIVFTDPDDASNTTEYYIPSFGYLKSEIERLSASLNTMTNITDGSGSRIRLSDGSYRKIIASKIPSEAPTITSVDSITSFNFKSNWFFEDMLNPSLYVTWDMSTQISEETERVMIQRYMLKCDTQKKIDVFDNKFKGRNDIDYREFLTILLNNSIKYTLDDEIKDLPPRSKRYFGTFSVIRIDSEKDLNGNTVKRYILDSLEFTDSRTSFENTRLLSVGDYVEVNSETVTTRYEVIYVEASENKIGLKCVEGCEGVTIGADTLKISASQDTTVTADIPVGYDEREVIFVKAIDPDSNIPSNKWSPGVGFYTNELTYVDSTGASQTLQRFYQKNVIDFGQVLLSYANDYYPSIREGLVPDAPVLNYANGEGDFKIVQINMQLTEAADDSSLRSLISDKAKIQSELDNLATEIAKQKEVIQTTQYTSTNEKLKAEETLNTLISNQDTLTSNYNSVVNSIKAKYESGYSYSPKYRVRGFWDMPDAKVSPSSGTQEIIKFKIRYRYLSESGNANKEEEFTYTSGNSTVTGRFSNWNEVESKLRPRVKTTSGWDWEAIDTANPDDININQLDIPINPGEQVEIQVKSVSEAGWPSNPLESVWSDSIIVAFSDFAELEADDISSLIDQNKTDAAVANVTQLYSGIAEHTKDSFYSNDHSFAHTAERITSGFLSAEQTPITLYDKLQDLQNQITVLKELINAASGDINVVLIDNSDEQTIHTLNEGTTTYINAGNYVDSVKSLDDDKKNGAIITKTFYVDISTEMESGLYLLSKLTGDRLTMCPSTITNGDGNTVTSTPTTTSNDYELYDNVITPSTTSSTYYKEQGRYDLVPINLTNPEVLDFQIGSPNMYQSSQCRGQFIYSRFRNIGDTFDMYANYSSEDGSSVSFKYNADFVDGEVAYGDDYTFSDDYYNTSSTKISEFNELTGSSITSDSGSGNIDNYLNRLPKTWTKPDSASYRLLSDRKVILRNSTLTDSSTSRKTGTSSSSSSSSESTITKTATIKYEYPFYLFNSDSTVRSVSAQKNSIVSGDAPTSNATNIKYQWVSSDVIEFNSVVYTGSNPGDITIATIGTDSSGSATGYFNCTVQSGTSNWKMADSSGNSYEIYNTEGTSSISCSLSPTDTELTSLPVLYGKLNTSETLEYAGFTAYMTFNITYEIPSDSADGSSTGSGSSSAGSSSTYINRITRRVSNLKTSNGSTYTIVPKIQAAYGFMDLGKVYGTVGDDDDSTFVTTHKIGYEDRDRYSIGESTCNSYLFMSPVNHSEVQVDGDTSESSKLVKNGESLRVPIIYQFRMTDYEGNIFGNSSLKDTDLTVKNAKFANIIGLDIWTNRNALKPKQYDIVIYSTYGSVIDTNTSRTKTSTQNIINAANDLVKNWSSRIKDSKSLSTD